MKIPGNMPYNRSKVTWPSSASPNYGGDVGMIIHDGSMPYFKSTTGKTFSLGDALDEEIDKLYSIANREFEPVRPKNFSGLAIYGHLAVADRPVFFSRYAFRLHEANGTAKVRVDLGMSRALCLKILNDAGVHSEYYTGDLFMAPSRPCMNDVQFGAQDAKWHGRPTIHNPYVAKDYPRVSMFGALLTDQFVAYSPAAAISMVPTAEQQEDFGL